MKVYSSSQFALDIIKGSITYHYLSFDPTSHRLTCNRQLRNQSVTWMILRTPTPTAVITNTEFNDNIAFKEQKVLTRRSAIGSETSYIASRKSEMKHIQKESLKQSTVQQDYHWSMTPRYRDNNSNAEETKASTSKKLSGQNLIIFMVKQKLGSSLIKNKQYAMDKTLFLYYPWILLTWMQKEWNQRHY